MPTTYTRTIRYSVSSGGNADKKGGSYIDFNTLVLDTGAVSGAVVESANLYISRFKSYHSNYYLNVILNGTTGVVAGKTGNMVINSEIHEETMALSSLSNALATSTVTGFTLGVVATAGTSENKINVRSDAYADVVVTYGYITRPTAPTSMTLSQASVAPGTRVTLSWSGAQAGDYNAIVGYDIYRAEGSSTTYEKIATISSSATSGSTTVTAPTTNGASYSYKVETVAANSSYPGYRTTYSVTLTCSYASVSEPATVQLSTTNVAPGGASTLSWSGAAAGTNNPITGYQVYRLVPGGSSYTLLSTVSSTETSGSVTVYAPTTNGEAYSYKVMTIGTLSGSDSPMSTATATLTCTYTAPGAPPDVCLNGTTDAYVKASESLTLTWGTAADGANNPVTGYQLYKDGTAYGSTLAASVHTYPVDTHATAGQHYTYTVVALAEWANSASSAASVGYTYADPTSPTTVTASDPRPVAGSRITISWSGAHAGGNNALTGFKIYWAAAAAGPYTHIATAEAADTSCDVDGPTLPNQTKYYKVQALGAHSTASLSTVYAGVTSTDSYGPTDDTVVVIGPDEIPNRRVLFGDYDTYAEGKWTLCELTLSLPSATTRYVDVPFRVNGPIDQSTLLTDGDVRYGSRTLTVILETSEGTRDHRARVIDDLVNRLHGQRVNITLPDDKTRYITGRLAVSVEYSTLAHSRVKITGTCDPWRYSVAETVLKLTAQDASQTIALINQGRRVVLPKVTVIGTEASVTLSGTGFSYTLEAGTYTLSRVVIARDPVLMSLTGMGDVEIRYREAIL